ncbi:MAG: DUF2283 domain-containing protein [Verrucomicrobiota bacterium]
MKLCLDKTADALYLTLEEGAATATEEVAPGIILDFNSEGKVFGIEVLAVSKRVSHPLGLSRMQLETIG